MFTHQVTENKMLNYKFRQITFKAKNKNFSFKEGQFVRVVVGKNIFRCYSIASVPETLPYWQIFVDITPGGPGTTYLKNLQKGEQITTSGATGQFILGKKAEVYVFGATGCGIAPFLPMIETLTKMHKEIHLLWGLRYKKDIALKNQLAKWRKTDPDFKSEIILSQPEGGKWHGHTGHINPLILDKAKKVIGKQAAVYLSGSSGFIQETKELLNKGRVPAKSIYFEACY